MDWSNFLIFTLISSLEYSAMIIFIAALFRFRYFLNMKFHILTVCILLSYVSYTTRTIYELTIGSTLIQLGLMIVFIWLLFRVQVFYAALLMLAGFMGYSAVQMIFVFLFTSFNVFTTDDLALLKWPTHLLPIATSIFFYLVSWIIIKKNWGFSFVPDQSDAHFKIKLDNILMLGLITITFLILIILHGVGYTLIENLYIGSSLYIILFALIIVYAIRRDRNDD